MMKSPLLLCEEHEWQGYWWLPENPGNLVPGVLKYDGKGKIFLELIGSFSGFSYFDGNLYIPGLENWGIVYGTSGNSEITLFGVSTTESNVSFSGNPGAVLQVAVVDRAIVGAHILDKEDKIFSGFEVGIEDLNLWVKLSESEFKYEDIENEIGEKKCGISLSVKPIPAAVVSDNLYNIIHSFSPGKIEYLAGETVGTISDKVCMKVDYADPNNLQKVLEEVGILQKLISFAVSRFVGIISLRLYSSEGESLDQSQPVDVLYSLSNVGCPDSKGADSRNVLFTCELVSVDKVLPLWYELYGQLQNAANEILSLHYSPKISDKNALLTAVNSAEILHFNLEKQGKISEVEEMAECQSDRESRTEKSGEKDVENQKEGVASAPKVNKGRKQKLLKVRLKELANRIGENIISLVVPDVEYWAEAAAKSRNKISHEGHVLHYDENAQKAIILVTTCVVILNILKELGFSSENQMNIVRGNPGMRRAFYNAQLYLMPPKEEADEKSPEDNQV
ncbi:HEPN domain-containing protein [Rothia mucilaginosa]|uniref:ApeA N-terminal domain 1-containing protein n=1 Tax=Rothia mucilaginosa TaxID=43675 RepID=UPI003CF86CB9